jgi:hypothetical protein
VRERFDNTAGQIVKRLSPLGFAFAHILEIAEEVDDCAACYEQDSEVGVDVGRA